MSQFVKANRYLIIGLLCIFLMGCSYESLAEQGGNVAFPKIESDMDLYELCKNDINKEDFGRTACGIYIQGFFMSWSVSNVYFVGAALESPDNKTLHAISGALNKCSKGGDRMIASRLSPKGAAEWLITLVDQHIEAGDMERHSKKKHPKEDLEHKGDLTRTAGHLWDYFLSCGGPSVLYSNEPVRGK